MKRDHELGVLFWALHHKTEDRHEREYEEEEDGLAYLYQRDDELTTPVDTDSEEPDEGHQHHRAWHHHENESENEVEEIRRPLTPIDVHERPLVLPVFERSTTPMPMPAPVPVPEIHLTRATVYDPDPDPDPVSEEEEVYEYLVSPAPARESESKTDSQSGAQDAEVTTLTKYPERPLSTLSTMSTISISLSPISLGFPLPPSRPWPSIDHTLTDIESSSGQMFADKSSGKESFRGDSLFPNPRASLQVSYTSTPTTSSHCSSLDIHGVTSRITIYPPSHDHPPIRMSEMPHTPLLSEYGHGHGTCTPQNENPDPETGEEEVHGESRDDRPRRRPLPPLPPLRTRRSKPDIGIYIPTSTDIRPTEKRFRQVTIPRSSSRSRTRNGITSPLRLMRDKNKDKESGIGCRKGKGKYQSKSLRYQSELRLEGERRTKVIRESGSQGVSSTPPQQRPLHL